MLLGSIAAALSFAIVAALLVAAEFALRVSDEGGVSLYSPDPVVLARFRPNLDRTREGAREVVRFRTNRFGIRADHDTPPEAADLLILGDSNVAAIFLPVEQTLSRRIEALSPSGTRVIDFGTPGYGPDQSARRFVEVSERSRASAVVFHIFADNDLGDLLRNRLYQEGPGGWLPLLREEPEPEFLWQRQRLLRRAWLALGLSRRDFEHTFSGDSYYPPPMFDEAPPALSPDPAASLERWRSASELEFANFQRGLHTSWRGDHYDYGIALDPAGEAAKTTQRLLSHLLGSARGAFRGREQCFVVLIQPAESDLTDASRALMQSASPSYSPRGLVDLVIRAAADARVPYVDLEPSFVRSPSAYYFSPSELPRDDHWNETGIEKAAQLTADYLAANRCLRPAVREPSPRTE